MARIIAEEIRKDVYPGISTTEIASRIERFLNKENPQTAMRFNLRSGIRRLGPTGFPFEKFIGEIMEKSGYEVAMNQFVGGHCCTDYEIDFLAQKDNVLFVGECKYRNDIGGRVHIDDALANYARFLDISTRALKEKSYPKDLKIKSLLVTNAKFTDKTIDYARCVGVELLGWGYPEKNSLEAVIERRKLYPITILPSLNSFLAGFFAKDGKMLVHDVLSTNITELARKTRTPEKKLQLLYDEAELLLKDEKAQRT
ncbi:MAG: hypothetical protein V1905_00725 [bacterium]